MSDEYQDMKEDELLEFASAIVDKEDWVDFGKISHTERAVLMKDHMSLIRSDCIKHKSKLFSKKQIQRLENTHRMCALKPYKHIGINTNSKCNWDRSSYERYMFYTSRFVGKGFYTDDIIKVTKCSTHWGLVYFMLLGSEDGDIYIFMVTGHLLDRLVLRKGLDATRTESIGEALDEMSHGLILSNNGVEISAYGNDGIMIGLAKTFNYTPEVGGSTSNCHVVLLKTYVTNEMAHADQIAGAETGKHIKFVSEKMTGLTRQIYDSMLGIVMLNGTQKR